MAVLAGVSNGTVSKALSGRGQLKESTRRRVLATASELGFQPNRLAANLLSGRSFTVGLLASDSFGRHTTPLIGGMEDRFGAADLAVLLCDARGDAVREAHQLRTLLARRVDGFLVAGRHGDARPPLSSRELPVPVVYANCRSVAPEARSVVPDDRAAGRTAALHLAALGRRRIAHVTGPRSAAAVREREAGVRASLAEAGLALPDAHVLAGEWSEAWGRDAAERLLALDEPPDAIVCGSDQIARGAADALREHGTRVPRDVALVGHDDWEALAAATRPPLTSVDPDLEGLGRAAAEDLIALLAGEERRGTVAFPPRLVVRESCGALAPDDAALETV